MDVNDQGAIHEAMEQQRIDGLFTESDGVARRLVCHGDANGFADGTFDGSTVGPHDGTSDGSLAGGTDCPVVVGAVSTV
jgi:hypothetical protein